MLVNSEMSLIAQCLFKRSSVYQTGTHRLYFLEGETVDGKAISHVIHTIDEAHTIVKLYVNGQRKDVFHTLRWEKWCAARRKVVDQAHGEGTYDQFMKRILK